MKNGAAALKIGRVGGVGTPCPGPAADRGSVRLTETPSASLTFTDLRPDGDGFGSADADALLFRQLADWLDAHPGAQVVGCFVTDDAHARRQLVAAVERWDVTGPEDPPSGLAH